MSEEAQMLDPAASRPMVARPPSNRSAWLFAAAMGVLGIGLFSTLEARRAKVSSPAVSETSVTPGTTIASPAELAIPPDPAPAYPLTLASPEPVQQALPMSPRAQAAPRYSSPYAPLPPYTGPIASQVPQPAPAPAPAYVYQAQPSKAASPEGQGGKTETGRLTASRFTNPATTVPQGAVVQAVLETALDSNRAGFARAVVTRDVYSFDGSRILIPKGSKLFGEYKADLALGQNRALIQWHRLTRPDGVIIDIDSPSADPLGRAGVKGKVNSHFFTRFGGALLQSVLDVGVQLAARKATGDTIILGFPGAMPQVTTVRPDEVKPTLTVREGTSVSVFVVHDLDFTDVER